MSITRHHAEWLSLVEASGPFLNMEVLLDAFPQGLEGRDAERFGLLKQAYSEWQEDNADAAIHRAWVEWVLQKVLLFPETVLWQGQRLPEGLKVALPEYRETLRPDWVLVEPQTGRPRLLVQFVAPGQRLEGQMKGKGGFWTASPATRMMELLRGTGVWLGLVTNGEHWLLVAAPRGGVELLPGVKYQDATPTVSYISWYANLWVEEPITLRAFVSLLGASRFFRAEPLQSLEGLLARSADSQEEVTNQLGYQVRKAIQVLVQKLDRIDQDRGRELFAGVSERELYEAALFVMMRLVFLFSAEEKGLLLLGDRLYDQYYAVSTLRAELREMADKYGEEVLERRRDAWCRLLATFRAVYGGVEHDLFQLRAYGGDLFDPNKFPFLEGRKGGNWREVLAAPLPVDNRTVLHLLEALQILQVRVPGGGSEPRRLSFRALEVEQIGHIYEGLLDRTIGRTSGPMLGLEGTKDKEPMVLLEELEELSAKGEKELLKFLKKETGRSESALKNRLIPHTPHTPHTPHPEERLFLIACGNDVELWRRVRPFAGLVRSDSFGYPVVLAGGSVYVTLGSDRRETGTHYTPKSLTEEVVRYALEPLVYEGVAAGKPREQWRLRPAEELLGLKVCDFAMGSGAFLVQSCRYLAQRLLEAWEVRSNDFSRSGKTKAMATPAGNVSIPELSELLVPVDEEERLVVAKRIVVERCIYGVDKNPLAVEMAKLSLWLETLQKDKPFTFLDHALKCGDSLVGVTVEQLRFWNLDLLRESQQLGLGLDLLRRDLDGAVGLRREIEGMPSDTPQQQEEKARLLAEANAKIKNAKDCADLLVSAYLMEGTAKERESMGEDLLLVAQGKADVSPRQRERLPDLEVLRPFHWELEFPEVFLNDASDSTVIAYPSLLQASQGFDALVGNPPFMGGTKITGALGKAYRDYLVQWVARGKRSGGRADLCAYFFLRATELIGPKGGCGLVATNTIAQGDTREVGLDQLVSRGAVIYRVVPTRPWSGTASLEVAFVWWRCQQWLGEFVLNDEKVSGITSYLTVPGQVVGQPYRLVANQGKSFNGSKTTGMGFVLTPKEAQALIAKDSKNKDVLFPYLNGQDLNSNPDQSPSRWVINFSNLPLNAETDDPKKPKGPPYAADYPDCLVIVEEKVKPERATKAKDVAAAPWWQFWRVRNDLYEAIAGCDRVLVICRHTKYAAFDFLPTGLVFSEALVVVSDDSYGLMSVICSSLHELWAFEYGSSLGLTLRYTSTDVFETFPFPPDLSKNQNLETIGEQYHRHRQQIMTNNQEGLTKTYNRFHNPDETATDIETLRQLHQQMDEAVATAYGWQDLDLGHDFHETKQGLRFTISEVARQEVLDRLLRLNHQRYAEEEKEGLHDKKKKKSKRSGGKKKSKKSQVSPGQGELDFSS